MTNEQPVLFSLVSGFTEQDVEALQVTIGTLGASRDWSLAPPQWVDEVDSSSCTRPEDLPIRTAGCVLFLSRAGGDRESERRALKDVEAVLLALQSFSGRTGLEIEVQVDRTQVGFIERGMLDDGIQRGLLDAWRRSIVE